MAGLQWVLARLGAAPPLPAEAEQNCRWFKAALSHMAKALPLFPRHQGQLTRMPPQGRRLAKGNGHVWGKAAAGWVRRTGCGVPGKPGMGKKAFPCRGEPQLVPKVHSSHQATLLVVGREPPGCVPCIWKLWQLQGLQPGRRLQA